MKRSEKQQELQRRRKEEQEKFIKGLKRYKEIGVTIYIDGKKSEDYKKLVECHSQGYFYMGDYISEDSGRLKEIHFDRVYCTKKSKDIVLPKDNP